MTNFKQLHGPSRTDVADCVIAPDPEHPPQLCRSLSTGTRLTRPIKDDWDSTGGFRGDDQRQERGKKSMTLVRSPRDQLISGLFDFLMSSTTSASSSTGWSDTSRYVLVFPTSHTR